MTAKTIFVLVYRLLALASLVWGLYGMAYRPYSILSLMLDSRLCYTFSAAFVGEIQYIALEGAFIFYGLFALHFAPKVLGFLYRE